MLDDAEARHALGFRNLARYHYFHKWGTDAQSYDALSHAIAGEDHARYLPKDIFIHILD